jgi:hypothetical protein
MRATWTRAPPPLTSTAPRARSWSPRSRWGRRAAGFGAGPGRVGNGLAGPGGAALAAVKIQRGGADPGFARPFHRAARTPSPSLKPPAPPHHTSTQNRHAPGRARVAALWDADAHQGARGGAPPRTRRRQRVQGACEHQGHAQGHRRGEARCRRGGPDRLRTGPAAPCRPFLWAPRRPAASLLDARAHANAPANAPHPPPPPFTPLPRPGATACASRCARRLCAPSWPNT